MAQPPAHPPAEPVGPATSARRLRTVNQRAVLDLAFDAPSFSASDAIVATGLTRATVLRVAADLLEVGWLEEETGPPVGPGRPARRFRLRADAGLIAGIDAGAHTVRAHLWDLRGEVRSQVEVDIALGIDAPVRVRLRAVSDALEAAAEEARIERERIIACTVGVPAPVGADGCSPRGGNDFWARMNPGTAALERALRIGGSVGIDNDANLAALAESACHGGDVIVLLSGERLGAGLVVDGRLLRGARGGAGEMRHLNVLIEPEHGTDGIGPLLRRSAARLLAHSSQRSTLRDTHEDSSEPSAPQILQAAEDGDALAAAAVEEAAQRLARIVVGAATLVDVERVVLAGAITDAAEPLRARTEEIVRRVLEPPLPRLELSRLGRDAVVIGAAQAALADVRADPLAVGLP